MQELSRIRAQNETRGHAAPLREASVSQATPRPGELEQDLEALGEAARRGERGARDALWRRVRPSLERLALVCGVNRDDVPDVVQETMLFADSRLARFDAERGSFRSWLGSLLATRARNHLRAVSRRQRLARAFGISAGREVSRDGAEASDARLLLHRLAEHLSLRQREVLALYEIAGLSAEESARALGMTAAGVRSSARDARRKLAEVLEVRR